MDESKSCFERKQKTTPNYYGSTKLTIVSIFDLLRFTDTVAFEHLRYCSRARQDRPCHCNITLIPSAYRGLTPRERPALTTFSMRNRHISRIRQTKQDRLLKVHISNTLCSYSEASPKSSGDIIFKNPSTSRLRGLSCLKLRTQSQVQIASLSPSSSSASFA
jgi:hypothetical protein